MRGNAEIPTKAYWIKPEFAFTLRTPNVDVGRLCALVRVKVKTKSAYSEYRWHPFKVLPLGHAGKFCSGQGGDGTAIAVRQRPFATCCQSLPPLPYVAFYVTFWQNPDIVGQNQHSAPSYSGSFHGTVRRVLAPGSRGFVSLGFETAHEMPACPVSWSRMSHLPGVMMASPEKPLPSRRPKSARYRVRRTSAVARALKKSAGPSHVRLVTIPPREARTFLWQTSGTFRKVSNGQDTSVLLHSGNLLPQA